MQKNQFKSAREQIDILMRGVVDFYVPDEFAKKLEHSRKTNTPLIIKAGFDPTAPDLHLGHAVLLTKMRQFQDLGHEVVFLIGDFTGLIGDPSGKNTTRPVLTEKDVLENAETYKTQVFKILDKEKTRIEFNSKWLSSLSFADVIRLAGRYSVARMIEREDFSKRLSERRQISMHELLYPLAQAYDSVVLKADVELGGSDQLFNLLVGRDIMHRYGLKPQCVLTVPILEGIEAKEENGAIVGEKMSKSLGNYIGLQEPADQQFAKIMSICDPLMWRYYELLSSKSTEEIKKLKAGHPKTAKIELAMEISQRFHGEEAATAALNQFNALFGAGRRETMPDDAPEFQIDTDADGVSLVQALVATNIASSNSEAKRLIRQKSVVVDGKRIDDLNFSLSPGNNYALRVGKKRWARLYCKKRPS